MGTLNKRKVFAIGRSRAITLPKPWLDFHGERATRELTIFGDSVLILAPKGLEKKAKRIMEGIENNERGD